MIPRTSIEEANRHLQQLHERVNHLETTVKEQNDNLIAKDKLLQIRVSELASTKDKEIEGLANKLLASERTVSVLQEELERKNQQILALQHSHSKLRRLLNFKDDVKDLLKTMEDAEENLALDEGDTDGLLSFYQRSSDSVAYGINGPNKKIRKKKFIRSAESYPSNAAVENGTPSEGEVNSSLGGKEFYL
ncbi:vimentin-type intermediate filament-associated coiled-coil protein [Plakobranchus ocellatus]|uniref:Vimentin-type intermediate filament-associated coiled-coil protein n=1 Tax=Plakobranchus ocellatus TaxID=259542 RepID=A0AAV4A8Z6_9GAST|nr:vimentin-type intermediate filament-associated coiled-coil protein [Plakobranchus ocellatus]